jgi:hypothetical protein
MLGFNTKAEVNSMVNSAPRPPTNETDSAKSRPSIGLLLVVAAVVSGVAGLLAHAAGNNVPGAILTGGGAFAGALGLLLAVAHYAGAPGHD